MSASYVVLRPFSGKNGERYQSGVSVDASAWPLREALESQGFIKSVPKAEQGDDMPSRRGRRPAVRDTQEV